ncbi:MAG: bifunctional [glutamine synthetase] adenylyltransferase/[glutamine synthetase]-adenylyl-L-tyrosine phosphorylase [Alphaproteobacteria bacterium]
MSNFPLLADLRLLPKPARSESAAIGRARWLELGADCGDSEIGDFAHALAEDAGGRALLDSLFGNSPFLGQCARQEMAFLRDLLIDGTGPAFDAILDGIAATTADRAGLMRVLRVAKRRAALMIAIADIGGLWTLEEVSGALSALADAALQAALDHLLRAGAARGQIDIGDAARPSERSGLFVLAMGKLGARELNYSSDIDLIVLYDSEHAALAGVAEPQEFFVRLTRNLVPLIAERTADGYVFRTDLRLRPDPRSTPLALSVLAAETYYESAGQNWERAAMIKARPAAGDVEAGAAFLSRLRPFVWRRHLDFAAIADIQPIKRQIDTQSGARSLSVAGHNIKLGAGGIREIEFFAQTQQLIWGGRDPELRQIRTVDALEALARTGHAGAPACRDMIAAYRYLRVVEHRLQMIDDRQTQTLPEDEDALTALAVFLGYADLPAFTDDLMGHLERVRSHYAELFQTEDALSAESGNLVFTGVEDDPNTLRTLARMGFRDGPAISGVIRNWHHGQVRATRSTRARELLTTLMPGLLAALARTADPDTALMKFNDFLTNLPSGVQIFSLLNSNPELLDLLADIAGSAPRLAEALGRRPILLDGVLTRAFLVPPADAATRQGALEDSLIQARDYQDVLDICRRWVADEIFQVGVQLLRGSADAVSAGPWLSDTADIAIRVLKRQTEEEFAAAHGRLLGGGMAVLALGKLGAREMSIGSDIDLVFVYANPEGHEDSDGDRPLVPAVYFARLGQRLISALNARTAEGRAYDVDMRLRPFGQDGPIAIGLDAFVKYQGETAWTWEQMALTRARIVCGPPELRDSLAATIRATLTRRRDPEALRADIAKMRGRIASEHKPDSPWDVKYVPGGLIDVEFIAQYLQLRHAHERPEILAGDTLAALAALAAAGLLETRDAEALTRAARLWRSLQNMLRLVNVGYFDETKAAEGLRDVLLRAGGDAGAADFADLKRRVLSTAEEAAAIFARLIGPPPETPLRP